MRKGPASPWLPRSAVYLSKNTWAQTILPRLHPPASSPPGRRATHARQASCPNPTRAGTSKTKKEHISLHRSWLGGPLTDVYRNEEPITVGEERVCGRGWSMAGLVPASEVPFSWQVHKVAHRRQSADGQLLVAQRATGDCFHGTPPFRAARAKPEAIPGAEVEFFRPILPPAHSAALLTHLHPHSGCSLALLLPAAPKPSLLCQT